MLIKNTGVLCFASGLVILWLGCSGNQDCVQGAANLPTQELTRRGEACVHDADCRSGFCDRAICVDSGIGYGNPCDPPPPDALPIDNLPDHLCAGYLCLEGRCRSCQSTAECKSYYGMGLCREHTEAGVWQPRSICYPWSTQRPAYTECTEDAQCASSFCDRGKCANADFLAEHNYGEVCVSGPPQAPSEDLRVAPPGGRCEGYLCVDQRCRSCQSDAECNEGPGDLKCIYLSNWPGKVCISLSEAERRRPPVVLSIAPTTDHSTESVPPARPVPPAPRSPSRCP